MSDTAARILAGEWLEPLPPDWQDAAAVAARRELGARVERVMDEIRAERPEWVLGVHDHEMVLGVGLRANGRRYATRCSLPDMGWDARRIIRAVDAWAAEVLPVRSEGPAHV
jgi:hypothetical protein